jgi:hypothetical protein
VRDLEVDEGKRRIERLGRWRGGYSEWKENAERQHRDIEIQHYQRMSEGGWRQRGDAERERRMETEDTSKKDGENISSFAGLHFHQGVQWNRVAC